MRPVTKANLGQTKICCTSVALKVAQCCSKSSKVVSGCHD